MIDFIDYHMYQYVNGVFYIIIEIISFSLNQFEFSLGRNIQTSEKPGTKTKFVLENLSYQAVPLLKLQSRPSEVGHHGKRDILCQDTFSSVC